MSVFKRILFEDMEVEPESGDREPSSEEWAEFEEREEKMMREYEIECEAKRLKLVK